MLHYLFFNPRENVKGNCKHEPEFYPSLKDVFTLNDALIIRCGWKYKGGMRQHFSFAVLIDIFAILECVLGNMLQYMAEGNFCFWQIYVATNAKHTLKWKQHKMQS